MIVLPVRLHSKIRLLGLGGGLGIYLWLFEVGHAHECWTVCRAQEYRPKRMEPRGIKMGALVEWSYGSETS